MPFVGLRSTVSRLESLLAASRGLSWPRRCGESAHHQARTVGWIVEVEGEFFREDLGKTWTVPLQGRNAGADQCLSSFERA